MRFNKHYILEETHARFSASKSSWLRYSDEQLETYIRDAESTKRGTELHDLAKKLIQLKQKMGRSPKTLNMYVNDAIGFRMKPEQMLVYSEYVYGTADAVSFRDNLLRIHDLKTGRNKTNEEQLYIYAGLFCLEYGVKPFEIKMELRIYQNDEIRIYEPDPGDIAHIMDRIITVDRRTREIKAEEDDE